MNPGISRTHMRPSASKSMAIGSLTSGSLATSSIRYPGGNTNVFISSWADNTGAFSGVLRGAGGQAVCGLTTTAVRAIAALTIPAKLFQ